MAQGSVVFPKSSETGRYLECKVEWSSVADNSMNSSDVTVSLYVRKDHHTIEVTQTTTGNWGYSLEINGDKVTGSVKKTVLTDWVLVYTKVATGISHNDDGTKTITIAGSVSGPSTSSNFKGHTASGSAEVELDTIPRASVIRSVSGGTLGKSFSVSWLPLSESFTYKVIQQVGEWKREIVSKPATLMNISVGSMLPMEIARQITDDKKGTMQVTLYTYSDNESTVQVGEGHTVECEVLIPDTAKPTAHMTLTPVSNLPDRFGGLCLQGRSRVKAEITADFHYDAQPGIYDMTIDGKTYGEEEDYTSEYLTEYGTFSVVGRVVDSRTFEGIVEKDIFVIPYSNPKLLDVSVERCDENGNLTDSGTYLRIKARRSYSPVKDGDVQKNFCAIKYRYKTGAATQWPDEWDTLLEADDLSADVITTAPLLGTFSEKTTYEVQVMAIDYVGGTASTTVTIPTDSVYMHRCGPLNSMGLGKYVERPNLLDTAWDINTDGNLSVAGDIFIGGKSLQEYIKSIVNEGG